MARIRIPKAKRSRGPRPNSYPTKCCVCERVVPAKRGTLHSREDAVDEELRTGRKKWLVVCSSARCVEAFAGRWLVDDLNQRELCEDGTIVMPFDRDALPLLRSIARGTMTDGAWIWRVNENPGDRARVLQACERLKLDIHPRWRETVLPADVEAMLARARENGAWQHQIEGITWLATRPTKADGVKEYGALLADEMGLGKSSCVIHSIRPHERLVVVCPANAKAVWDREPRKWLPDRFTSIHVCEGNESFRWPDSPAEVVVINYDITPLTRQKINEERRRLLVKRYGVAPDPEGKKKADRLGAQGIVRPGQRARLWMKGDRITQSPEPPLLDVIASKWKASVEASTLQGHSLAIFHQLALLCCWVDASKKLRRNRLALKRNRARMSAGSPPPGTVLVLDEAHRAANSKARRSANVRALTGMVNRVISLTGTPCEDDPRLLRGLLDTGRCNPWGYMSFNDAFKGELGEWGGIEYARKASTTTARGALDVTDGVTDRLSAFMLRRTKSDVTDLPPKIYSEIIVPMSAEILDKLDKLSVEMIERGIDWSALVKGVEARPSESEELPLVTEMSRLRKLIAIAMIPRMLEEVEVYEEQHTPLVVFSDHRAPIEELDKRDGWATILGGAKWQERKAVEDEFQREESSLVGVGGTFGAMAEAITLTRASHMLIPDAPWSLSKLRQGEDRIHRIGTKYPCNIAMMVADHVLAHHVHGTLSSKDESVTSILARPMDYQAKGGLEVESREAWLARLPSKVRARYVESLRDNL